MIEIKDLDKIKAQILKVCKQKNKLAVERQKMEEEFSKLVTVIDDIQVDYFHDDKDDKAEANDKEFSGKKNTLVEKITIRTKEYEKIKKEICEIYKEININKVQNEYELKKVRKKLDKLIYLLSHLSIEHSFSSKEE